MLFGFLNSDASGPQGPNRAFVQSMFHGSFFGIASAQTGIRVYAGYPQ
jgi:hypothetical protein